MPRFFLNCRPGQNRRRPGGKKGKNVKYFIDTEFWERPNTISLISLAIVAEDGREYYKWNHHYPPAAKQDAWLKEHVFPFAPVRYIERNGCQHLNTSAWTPSQDFATEILEFVGADTNPEFWGYYCDYDWVIFCWQFGRMINLPNHFPMYCRDLKQVIDENKACVNGQVGAEHDALADARWIRDTYFILRPEEAPSMAQEARQDNVE